jgi:hypothetical protein
MKNLQKIARKRSDPPAPDNIVSVDGFQRDREKKKTTRATKRQRERLSGREGSETPRASTLPSFPKQRIDD